MLSLKISTFQGNADVYDEEIKAQYESEQKYDVMEETLNNLNSTAK